MFHQAAMQVALMGVRSQAEKIKIIGILEDLLCKFGLGRRQSVGEIRESAAESLV